MGIEFYIGLPTATLASTSYVRLCKKATELPAETTAARVCAV